MKINVTQQHIDQGEPGNCTGCPTALAINDAIEASPRYHAKAKAQVGRGLVIISWPNSTLKLYHDLPHAAHNFVGLFDTKQPVQPFTFNLIQRANQYLRA